MTIHTIFSKIWISLVTALVLVLSGCAGSLVLPSTESSARVYTETPETLSRELQIYVIDVGQGDATLLVGPSQNGRSVAFLIDAGGLDPDGGAMVTSVLQAIGVTELDYVLLTHYDADHMGGFVTAYDSTALLWDAACEASAYFPSQAMIDLGDSDKDTDSVLEYLSCRDANLNLLQDGHVIVGSPPHENIGNEFDLQGGYTATIVAGNGYVIDQDERVANVDTDNEESIAVLVSGPGEFYFLVTGDLTGQVYGTEDAAVEPALGLALQARGIDVSILRVGHHGSGTSSAPQFLQTIHPEVSIISVGDDNTYGHPNCDTLANLTQESTLVLQTEAGNAGNCAPYDHVVVANDTIRVTVKEGDYKITSQDLSYECTVTKGCE